MDIITIRAAIILNVAGGMPGQKRESSRRSQAHATSAHSSFARTHYMFPPNHKEDRKYYYLVYGLIEYR